MKAVAYLRVSRSDLDLRNQKIAIEEYAALNKIEVVEYFWDEITGASDPRSRKGFQAMLQYIQEYNIPIVIVYALDRIGRSFKEVQNVIWAIENLGVTLISVREHWLQTLDQSIRSLVLSILTWAADFERKLISERTKQGLEKARLEGKHIGRPRKLDEKKIKEIKKLRKKGLSIRSLARIYNVSPRTIQRVLNGN